MKCSQGSSTLDLLQATPAYFAFSLKKLVEFEDFKKQWLTMYSTAFYQEHLEYVLVSQAREKIQ